MYKALFKNLLILISALLLSAAGYRGDLPQLGTTTRPAETESKDLQKNHINVSDNLKTLPVKSPDLAPKPFPDIYSGVIIKQGKYTNYLKDLDGIIPILEKLRDSINSEDRGNIQIISARANLLNLYVAKLQAKYNNRPEHYYESYKQIIKANKIVNEAVKYLRDKNQYRKTFRGSLSARKADEIVMNRKLDSTLAAINAALDVLKNDSQNSSF